MSTAIEKKISARGMFRDLCGAMNGRGGFARIMIRTIQDKRMNKYSRDQKPVRDGAGNVVLVKSGVNKGKAKMQGDPSPYWDFAEDKSKVVKVSIMQVSLIFDYERIVQSRQWKEGLEPDFQAGLGQPTWKRKHVIFKDEDGKEMKTPFVYKVPIDPETGTELPIVKGQEQIYLWVLPQNVIDCYYEDIKTGDKIEKKLVEPYERAKTDKEAVAEAQGLKNAEDAVIPLTIDIRNVVTLAAARRKYYLPLRKMANVSAVEFESIEDIVYEEDESQDMWRTAMDDKITTPVKA